MRRASIALIALALVAAACGDDDPGATDMQLVASDLQRIRSSATGQDIAAIARAQQEFALALYAVLADQEGDLVFSPTSLHIALAMALVGARGDTESQMAAALGMDDIDPTVFHDALNALDALIESRNRVDEPHDGEERKVELSIANSIWGQSGFGFEEAYLDLLAANYGAGLRVVDFMTAADEARHAINAWVAAQTNDRIPELLPPGAVDALTRLVLTNAVYLDATWAIPFSPDATSNAAFVLLDGTGVTVPTMHGLMGVPYASGDGWQAVDLAYTGGELSMLVIVPDSGRFDEVERSITTAIDEARAGMETTQVRLGLPTFEIRTQADLNSALAAVGIVDAFDPTGADFTGISTEAPLYLSGVLHEAFIAVDEAGTEAAAATAVVVGTTSAPIEVVDLDIDRPFLFVIQDRDSGAILFLGRVVDPR